jgi:hypothetical protein
MLPFVAIAALACSPQRRVPPPDMSGFLDDYTLLRPGGSDDIPLVYRNPDANWPGYDAIILEPVTIWRSGRKSLDPVPEKDLLRLAYVFEQALRARLGGGFRLVDRPGPGVMRARLGITQARGSDPVLDVLSVPPGYKPPAKADGAIDPQTRHFLAGAVIEGELVDAQTNTVLAQGVDGPPRADSPALGSWPAFDRALAQWVDRLCARLERRTHAATTPPRQDGGSRSR